MATEASSLLASASCYVCHLNGQRQLVKLAILRGILLALDPTADVTPNALLARARCYANYSPGEWALFRLGLWRLMALGVDAAAEVDPDELLAYSTCYQCHLSGMGDLLELGLLTQTLTSLGGTVDTNEASCYACHTSGIWALLELGLLQAIVEHYDVAADTSANTLLGSVRCHACAMHNYQLYLLGLMDSFFLTADTGYPSTLIYVGGGAIGLVGGGTLELVGV